MQFREKLEKIRLCLEIPLIFEKRNRGIMETDKSGRAKGTGI